MRSVKKQFQALGYTLLETVVTLAVVAALSSGAIVLYQNFQSQQTQVQVQAALEQVATAQLAYLQNNPSLTYSNISSTSLLLPFLPGGALPAALSGATVSVNVNPPTATLSGRTYTARVY